MQAQSQNAAEVSALSGRAFVARAGQESALNPGDLIYVGDSVHTDTGGKVNLHFKDGTELRLGEISQVELRVFAYDPGGASQSSFAAHIARGMVRTVTGEVVRLNPEGFSLSSPLGAADIRGTTVDALVQSDSTVFMITDMGGGRFVVITSAFGEELVVYLPGQGVEIYEDDAVRMAFLDSVPQGMREKFGELLESMLDVRSSHDDFALLFGNAEFLAALGARDVGRGIGLLAGDDADIVIRELEQLGVPESMLFLGDSNTAAVWPTEFWTGSDAAEFWAGSMNQHHNAHGLGGNDTMVVFNGRDKVYGGSGDDVIVKISQVMTGGNFLYGGDESLDHVVLDNDHIILRGPGATDDPLDPSSYTDPANAGAWTAIDMSGGAVYGSAETLNGITGPGGANTIDLYGDMSGGAIYGKAQTITDSDLDGAAINIKPAGGAGGAMSGGVIYGDAYEISGTSQCGDDTFNITAMSGGTIYGDAAKISGANVTGGDNKYNIKTMTGGTIVAGTGGDTIEVSGILQGTMKVKGEVEAITVAQANLLNASQDNSKIEVDTLNGTISITEGSIDIHLDEISGNSTVKLKPDGPKSLVRVDELNNGTLTLEGGSDHTLYMESITSGTPSAGGLKATGGAAIKVDSIDPGDSSTITLTAKSVELGLVQGGGGGVNLSGQKSVNATVNKQIGAGISFGEGDDTLYMDEMSGGSVRLGDGKDFMQVTKMSGGSVGLGAGKDFMQVTKLGAENEKSSISISFGGAAGGDGEKDVLDLKNVTLLGDTTINLYDLDGDADGNFLDKVNVGGLNPGIWYEDASNNSYNWTCDLTNGSNNTLRLVLMNYSSKTPIDLLTTIP